MNEQEMIRKLNSVGKTVFVLYFRLFLEYAEGKISKDKCIDELVEDKVSNYNGASIRCSNAKKIFDKKMECDALMTISKSRRLSSEVIQMAKKIITERCDGTKN